MCNIKALYFFISTIFLRNVCYSNDLSLDQIATKDNIISKVLEDDQCTELSLQGRYPKLYTSTQHRSRSVPILSVSVSSENDSIVTVATVKIEVHAKDIFALGYELMIYTIEKYTVGRPKVQCLVIENSYFVKNGNWEYMYNIFLVNKTLLYSLSLSPLPKYTQHPIRLSFFGKQDDTREKRSDLSSEWTTTIHHNYSIQTNGQFLIHFWFTAPPREYGFKKFTVHLVPDGSYSFKHRATISNHSYSFVDIDPGKYAIWVTPERTQGYRPCITSYVNVILSKPIKSPEMPNLTEYKTSSIRNNFTQGSTIARKGTPPTTRSPYTDVEGKTKESITTDIAQPASKRDATNSTTHYPSLNSNTESPVRSSNITKEPTNVITIAAACLCCVTGLIVVIVLVCLLLRRRRRRQKQRKQTQALKNLKPELCGKTDNNKHVDTQQHSTHAEETRRKKMFLLYFNDNEYHNNVVHLFAGYLQNQCMYDVQVATWHNNRMLTDESRRFLNSFQNSDCTVIVNSEGLFRVSWKENISNNNDSRRHNDIYLTDILSSEKETGKTIAVHFDYTDERFAIENVCKRRSYRLMNEFREFIIHVHQGHPDMVNIVNFCQNIEQNIKIAIANADDFIKAAPQWFDKKFAFPIQTKQCHKHNMFHTQDEIINEVNEHEFNRLDSGIDEPMSSCSDCYSNTSPENSDVIFGNTFSGKSSDFPEITDTKDTQCCAFDQFYTNANNIRGTASSFPDSCSSADSSRVFKFTCGPSTHSNVNSHQLFEFPNSDHEFIPPHADILPVDDDCSITLSERIQRLNMRNEAEFCHCKHGNDLTRAIRRTGNVEIVSIGGESV